jgi:hypothetical protein
MSLSFTKVKLCRPCSLRAVGPNGFGRFQSSSGRLVCVTSRRAQMGQPFQVPTGWARARHTAPAWAQFLSRPRLGLRKIQLVTPGFPHRPTRYWLQYALSAKKKSETSEGRGAGHDFSLCTPAGCWICRPASRDTPFANHLAFSLFWRIPSVHLGWLFSGNFFDQNVF